MKDQLQAACEENNATFVDNENNFTFRNGAFANDGLHLSDSGVDRLMSNLGLPPPSYHQYATSDNNNDDHKTAAGHRRWGSSYSW